MAIPWAEKKLKHIAPPTSITVRDLEELLHDADLVAHLGAAEHHAEGPGGIVADGGQLSHLALEQQARIGGKQVRHALGGRVRAVGGAEGVVHVQIGQRRQPPRELRIVARLAGLEAAVLEHQHLPRPEPSRQASPTSGPTTAGASVTSEPSSSPSRAATGAIENAGSAPFGRPRCETSTSAAPRSRSSSMVGSAARIRASSSTSPSASGTLKSTPNQNAPALHGGVPHARLVEAQLVPTRRQAFGSSTLAASSTQRFE